MRPAILLMLLCVVSATFNYTKCPAVHELQLPHFANINYNLDESYAGLYCNPCVPSHELYLVSGIHSARQRGLENTPKAPFICIKLNNSNYKDTSF